METSQLYTLAARFGRRALSILTVSDMMDGSGYTSSEERETGFRNMVEIALSAASAS
jgi:purine-nucleoside phosphorylase